MHLGFLTSEYPHPRIGPAAGIGTSIKNNVTALVGKKIEVSIFIYGQREDDIFTEDGIKFHLIRQRKYKMFGWFLHRKFLQNYINKYIAIDGINAVEAPDWTGITAFMKLIRPLVIRLHGSDAYFCQLENRPQKKKNFWYEKMALEGADHLLSVSQFTAEETRQIFRLKKEIKVIPNSVDVARFFPRHEQEQPGTILYFGSLIRKKGVLELSQIFNKIVEEMPTARLKLMGRDVRDVSTGRSTKKIMQEQFTPGTAEKVTWLGIKSYEETIEEVGKANIVVLPSFAEALPMTWIEAMAMEKALVTSNIGWAQEVMINGVTGFTVNPRDHKLYAQKVIQLLTNPALAVKMGRAARENVIKEFSTEVVVKRNFRFYEKVLYRQRKEKRA